MLEYLCFCGTYLRILVSHKKHKYKRIINKLNHNTSKHDQKLKIMI